MLEEMVNLFPKESKELLSRMHEALDAGDMTKTGQAAHRLRGNLLYLGAISAMNASAKVEKAAQSGDPAVASGAITELEHQVDLLKRTLEARKR